jgi:hypothetical protein
VEYAVNFLNDMIRVLAAGILPESLQYRVPLNVSERASPNWGRCITGDFLARRSEDKGLSVTVLLWEYCFQWP